MKSNLKKREKMYFKIKLFLSILIYLAFLICTVLLDVQIKKELPYVFRTDSLPDKDDMPTLSNGHIGFSVFGDTVYMNGLYNGGYGLSHRARIPNYGNLLIDVGYLKEFASKWTHSPPIINVSYSLNVKSGIFQQNIIVGNYFKVMQLVYPHRFYNRAIINHIYIYRLGITGDVPIQLHQHTGNDSEDITFTMANKKKLLEIIEEPPHYHKEYKSNKKIRNSHDTIVSQCGYTNEVEDPEYQSMKKFCCVLWNHVPEEITLKDGMQVMTFTFVMTVDGYLSVAKQEIIDVLQKTDVELLALQRKEWGIFWSSFCIEVTGNIQLAQIIYGSIFYLVSSLPANKMNQPINDYFCLSPTGLGKGGSNLKDYEGHCMWDSEIWMLPVLLLMNPKWSEHLLDYRFKNLEVAKMIAGKTGYKGARYPWESAYTGGDVTQPCCLEIFKFEQHITADISFAARNHLAATHDLDWFQRKGCDIAIETAKFWASRVNFNETTRFYDINNIMGPDEDHPNVSNNIFTNVAAGYSLYFGEFSRCLSNNTEQFLNFNKIARHIKLPYDTPGNYHPQFEGYTKEMVIKQADTVLIGYPLQYKMNISTRENDLNLYESVVRTTGPAMTWAMHSINRIDLKQYEQADLLFKRSFKDYVYNPFQVWHEVIKNQEGATNFITGAGGFLQAILYGYSGIRLFIDRLVINSPRYPKNLVGGFYIKGFQYLASEFSLNITMKFSRLRCRKINTDIPLLISFGHGRIFDVGLNRSWILRKESKTIIYRKNYIFGKCKLPVDIIGIPKP